RGGGPLPQRARPWGSGEVLVDEAHSQSPERVPAITSAAACPNDTPVGQVVDRRRGLRARVNPVTARIAAPVSAIADPAFPGRAQVGSYMSGSGPSAPR